MANKRTLKKEINYVAGELLSECLCNKYLIPGTDAEKVDALMGKLRADFDKAIDEIFEDLEALNA